MADEEDKNTTSEEEEEEEEHSGAEEKQALASGTSSLEADDGDDEPPTRMQKILRSYFFRRVVNKTNITLFISMQIIGLLMMLYAMLYYGNLPNLKNPYLPLARCCNRERLGSSTYVSKITNDNFT